MRFRVIGSRGLTSRTAFAASLSHAGSGAFSSWLQPAPGLGPHEQPRPYWSPGSPDVSRGSIEQVQWRVQRFAQFKVPKARVSRRAS